MAKRVPAKTKRGTDRLLEIVARLRGEGGCPWDREQTLKTLKQFLVEESYELLDAIDSGDPAKHKDELGDVLLQVALQAQIRKEEGRFDFDDVAGQLADKLIRRHPHVFGDVKVSGSGQVLQNWEAIKSKEKPGARRSVLEGVPRHLPALQKAQRIQSRAAKVGFDWVDVKDVAAKVDEEWGEVREAMEAGDPEKVAEELGDLLFAIVNLSRFHKVLAEEALQGTINKFTRRFQEIESRIHGAGRELKDCSLEEMDAIWNDIKRRERKAAAKRSGRWSGRKNTKGPDTR